MGLPVLWLGALFSLGWEGCLLGIFYLNPLEWAGVQKRAFPKAKLVVREAYYAQRTADRPPPHPVHLARLSETGQDAMALGLLLER